MKLDEEKADAEARLRATPGDWFCAMLNSQEEPLRELMREVAREEIGHHNANMVGVVNENHELRTSVERLYAENERLRSKLTKADAALVTAHETVRGKLSAAEHDLAVMRERAENAECERRVWQERAEAAEQELERVKAQLSMLHEACEFARILPNNVIYALDMLDAVEPAKPMSDVEIVKRAIRIVTGKAPVIIAGERPVWDYAPYSNCDSFVWLRWLDEHAPNGDAK